MSKVETEYNYYTSSQIIHQNRCYLYGIIATPKDDEVAYLEVHDGTNSTENKVLKLMCGTGTTNSIILTKPILMQRGIYVSLGEDLEHYTVLWAPIED